MSAGAGPETLLAQIISHRWELAAAAVGAGLSFGLLPLPTAGFAAALAALVVFIAAVDLDRFIIPDVANAAMFALGLALVLTEAWPGEHLAAVADALLRALVTGGALLLLRFVYAKSTGIIGLGLGDVKLAAAGAPFLLWTTLPLALVLAATAGVLAIVTRAVVRREPLQRQAQLPFGAFLAPAIWLSFLLERLGLFPG